MSIRIAVIDPDNAHWLARRAPDVFDNDVDPGHLARFVADDRHILVVAVADATVVGMATAVEYFHPDKPAQLWINEVGVSPDYQRQGIGRRLVARLLDIARDRGCVCAWVGTETTNLAARACYAAVPGGEDPQPFLLYEWDIED